MQIRWKLLPWSAVALLAFGCDDTTNIKAPVDLPGFAPARDAGADADSLTPVVEKCRPVQGQAGPARQSIMGAVGTGGAPSQTTLTVDKLYDDFKTNCGVCHANAASPMGNLLVVSLDAFKTNLTDDSVQRLRSTDLSLIMPLGQRITLAERAPNHPLVLFASRLEAWFAAGKPDSFADPVVIDSGDSPDAPTNDAPFAVSQALGSSLTNIGNCVPAREIVNSVTAPMDTLDAKFAGMLQHSDLPVKLSQTDLISLDSQKLAEQGVISFAPAYTLWADDAHKMRYVRVPRGQTIQFNVATQSFEIPDNTRFYKTFLKEVKDVDGNVGYRKMETRLIVARRSEEQVGDPMPKINALFGSYQWNDDETEAVLVSDPYRDGAPFKDVLTEYVKDEEHLQQLLDEGNEFTDYFAEGAKRHYGIPGADRCVQCHMGQPSFVLGFLPLQIMRRPRGEGGVIEPAEPDELNQLERLIDYGLISGLKKDDIKRKIVPLEKSQGLRLPRNQYELEAQGYMLGNCAHCHNPNGYPTRTAPVLKDVLDFLPSASNGGIFQFPLTRMSPRTRRAVDLATTQGGNSGTVSVDVPYITPSLYDLGRGVTIPYSWNLFDPQREFDDRTATTRAPWRSLIFRNVQSGFTYSDDTTIYPHMPLHTAGHDCRAPDVMAQWMLSIVAVASDEPDPVTGLRSLALSRDMRAQPFVEIEPSHPRYQEALAYVDSRLQAYQADPIRPSCDNKADIVDPNSLVPALWPRSVLQPLNNPDFAPFQVPNRTSWVPLDTHASSDLWSPRGAFDKVLVQEDVSDYATPELQHEQTELIDLLKSMHRNDAFKAMATTAQPLALWKKKPGCNFQGVPTAQSFAQQPEYAFLEHQPPDSPVYMLSPGAAIFGMICVNCHGATFEANGRQSTVVSDLTGGLVSVANFKAGMFGPPSMVGAARESVFGPLAGFDSSVDDWGARYMAWMALGGTRAPIPPAVLSVVGENAVGGVEISREVTASANMLSVARAACETVRGGPGVRFKRVSKIVGDYALWHRVCSYRNPFPVRIFQIGANELTNGSPDIAGSLREWSSSRIWPALSLYRRGAAFAGVELYDLQDGKLKRGTGAEVVEPACAVVASDGQTPKATLEGMYRSRNYALPLCPPGATPDDPGVAALRMSDDQANLWVLQGAANAGFSVYSYIDAVMRGELRTQPDFDRCELLSMSAP